MRPFEARRCSLERSTGAATTRFCVKTAAAEAGTSLERIARSSAPVFFKPQAVAAKRNPRDRKSTRLNSSHSQNSYAVFCLKKKKINPTFHYLLLLLLLLIILILIIIIMILLTYFFNTFFEDIDH